MSQITEAQRVDANLFLSHADLYERTANHIDSQVDDLNKSARQFRREAEALRVKAKQTLGLAS